MKKFHVSSFKFHVAMLLVRNGDLCDVKRET
jgi:hypothetical protein